MARPGITALIPTFSEDVVAIFEQTDVGELRPVLEGAHLMRASVSEEANYFKHPLENGRSIVDHRIILPVEIELQIILTDRASILGAVINQTTDFETTARDVYEQMREFFLSGTFLAIQTRTATYANQILQAMPHEETSELFSGVTVVSSLSEIQIETADSAFVPADASDSDTVNRGRLNTIAPSSDISGLTGSLVA